MKQVKKKKILYLFTINFPYGNGESFLYNELQLLSEKFNSILLFPLDSLDKKISYNLPSNVSLNHFNMFESYSRPKVLMENLSLVLYIYAFEIINSKNKLKYIFKFKSTLFNLLNKIAAADRFYSINANKLNKNTVLYTYWFNQWTFILSVINVKYQKINLHTRIHGMDVFEEQHKSLNFFFQFRAFQFRQLKKVYSISQAGKNHLLQQNKISTNKIEVSRLGVNSIGLSSINNSNIINIVSCANCMPYKRIHLIIESLRKIVLPLKWVHFGDGELINELKLQATSLPKNIEVIWMGHKSNQEILQYYTTNTIDVFISTSETEGIPVSMMEAISAGIPIIATNVGGVKEIVTNDIGILLPKNFDTIDLALSITDEKWKLLDKKLIFQYWKTNFSAESNYNQLAHFLNQS